MLTTTDTTLSPPRGDKTVTPDPSGRAPPGFKWQVLYRRNRSGPWTVLVETATGQEAWDAMCSSREHGEYHPQLVRVGLFDAKEGGGR